jgi:hypothetical protein
MITRAIFVLLAAASPALAQTGITVMADSNRAVRTNFTLGNAQVTGLAALLDAKLATNGNAAALTNLTGGNVVGAVATASNIAGILAISNGGTGSTTASNARTALGLGTAATNAATAFQAASTNLTALAAGDGSSLTNLVPVTDASSLTNFPAELLRTNGDGSALTGITVDLTTVLPAYTNNAAKVLAVATNETGVEWIAISNTVTDASSLTNFPTLNQNTTGTASNVTGVIAIANGGTGSTNAAGARIGLLPDYTANQGKVLALNGSATDVEWITATGGGTSGVTSIDLSGGTTGLTASGGPITTSGTLTLGGTLALASGGTGATNASGARTALGLGTAATNPASAFQLASTNLDALANNNGANLTNVPISNTVTDASSLTNFPTFNQNTTGTASNVTGVVAIANGGTGSTNAAAAIEGLLPSYTSNGGKVLGLDTNLALTWTTNAGGGGGTADLTNVTGILAISNGGTGSDTAQGAQTNLTIISGRRVKIGQDSTNTSNAGITIGGATAISGVNSPAVVIGNEAFSSGSDSVVLGTYAKNTNAASGVSIGQSSKVLNLASGGIALGSSAIVSASDAVQIGGGSNATATTLQFRSAGTIDTNEWATLAALSTYPTTNIQVTVVGGATNTLVFSNGILTSVTSP